MKTETRKPLTDLILASTILVSCLTSAPLHAGNGDPHNGPTLTPIAIPSVDLRGIDQKTVENAISVCLAYGNTERGIKSLQQKIGERVFAVAFEHSDGGNDGPRVDFSAGAVFSDFDAKATTVTPLWSGVTLNVFYPQKFACGFADTYLVRYGNRFQQSDASTENGFEIEKNLTSCPARKPDPSSGKWKMIFPQGVHLPRVVFDSSEQICDYDDLMEPINCHSYLKGVALEMTATGQVALINADSGKVAPLRVDFDAYADCLKNEIQRGAK